MASSSLPPPKDPHNYRAVGWSMVAVAGGLAGIGLIALFIGDDVLYADNFQRAKTAEFEHCKNINFEGNACQKFMDRINTPISGVYTNNDTKSVMSDSSGSGAAP